jgi:hypothetical protein
MIETTWLLGLACVTAGIVGGGLEIKGIKLPAISSHRRQAVLVLAGLGMIVVAYGLGRSSGQPAPSTGFPITVGTTVGEGQPPGAGNISAPGITQRYTFHGSAGETIYLGTRCIDCHNFQWELVDPSGRQIANQGLDTDLGRASLGAAGTYTIEVSARDGFAKGSYGFSLTAVPPDATFPITIGATVRKGQPPGAGTISAPGAIQRYTFQGSAGSVVYLATQCDGCPALNWSLVDPSGSVVARADSTADMGREQLVSTGTYTVQVSGDGQTTGSYGFALTQVPDVTFSITIGTSVGKGQPPGAGNISVPGAIQRYTFQGSAGSVVYLATQCDGCPALNWSLVDPSGSVVARADSSADMGREELGATGTYTISTSANGRTTGPYEFSLTPVPQDTTFPITIGTSVTAGQPPGAGGLIAPGAIQRYTFQGTAGKSIDLMTLCQSNCARFRWLLTDPLNNNVAGGGLDQNPGTLRLLAGGTYTLKISGDGRAFGVYGFSLTPG